MEGHLIIAGGNLEYQDKRVHTKLIEYAGGPQGKLAIIPTASGADPQNSINYVSELWKELGMAPHQIVLLPVYGEEGTVWNDFPQGDDPKIIKLLDGVTGVWFTGGDQYYTHKAFIRKDGSDTEALKQLREIYKNGGVIGGTSAGAAIMSERMIAVGNDRTALNYPIIEGYGDYDDGADDEMANLRIVKGLGFFTDGVIDQHFDKRPRLCRLIETLLYKGSTTSMGYGVAEDTALLFHHETRKIEVLGEGAVYIVDCSCVERGGDPKKGNYGNIILHAINEGDTYDLDTHKIVFSHETETERYERIKDIAGFMTPNHRSFGEFILKNLIYSENKKLYFCEEKKQFFAKSILVNDLFDGYRAFALNYFKKEESKGYLNGEKASFQEVILGIAPMHIAQ